MVRTWQSGMLVGSPSPREQQQEPQKCYFQIPCTMGSLTEEFASLESWEFQQVTQRIPKAVVSWTKNVWGGKVPLQPRPSPQLRHQPGGASKALKRASVRKWWHVQCLQMLKHQDTTCMFMPIQDFLTHQQGTMFPDCRRGWSPCCDYAEKRSPTCQVFNLWRPGISV